MKKFFFITMIAILFCSVESFAAKQTNCRIKGSIKELKSGEGLGFATVALLNADSTLVTGSSADMNGNYEITAQEGNYIIKVSMIGYRDKTEAVKATGNVTIVPTISLEEDSQMLKGAVVSERVKLVEMKLDKMVVNISLSSFAQTSNGLELLKKSPGVTVDKDGNVKLNGKGVSIWIDGRPTYLDGEALKALLEGTSGASIDKIELMPNPSSKYDAAGQGGIINIKTKKNSLKGLHGNLGINGGGMYFDKHDLWSYQESFWSTVSYRTNKTNTTLNLYQGMQGIPTILEINTNAKSIGNISQETESIMSTSAKYINLHLSNDYFIDKKNVLGVIVSAPFTKSKMPVDKENNISKDYKDGNLYLTSTGDIDYDTKYRQYSANVNYTHIFDEQKNSEITTNLDWYQVGTHSQNYQTNDFMPADDSPAYSMNRNIDNLSLINIWSAKTDFQTIFWKNAMLETGLKWATSITDNDMNREETGFPIKKDVFKYREHIAAAYISVAKQFSPKWTAKVGLRGEYTNCYGDWKSDGTVTDNSYFDLFPTAFVGFAASEKVYLNFSYTRRINRPNFNRLNPSEMYISSRTFTVGNPKLKPEYSNNISFTSNFGRYFSVSVSYDYTTGQFNQMPMIKENGDQYIIWENYGKMYNPYINLNMSAFPVTKWLEWTVNLNGQYMKNVSSDSSITKSIPFVAGYTCFTFLLPSNWKIELDGYGVSKMLWGSYYIEPNYQSNLGIKKTLFDNKLSLSLSVEDLFRTSKSNLTTIEDLADKSSIMQKFLTQRVVFGLNWNFGKAQKTRQRNVGQVDEASRATSGNSIGN